MSVRVVLDLLDQFTNTIVLSLFHNRMWQSKYSEVNVNLVQHWLLVTLRATCVTANNGCPRSIVFNSFFMKRTCFNLLRTERFSCTLRVTCATANNGCPRSIMIWVWIWLVWLGNLDCWTTCPSGRWATSEPNSFIQSCFKEIFGSGRGDACTFSKITFLQFPSKTTFGIQ